MDWESFFTVVFIAVVAIGYLLLRYNRLHDEQVRKIIDQRVGNVKAQEAAAASAQPSSDQASSPAPVAKVQDNQKVSEERTVMDMWIKFLHDHNCDVHFDPNSDKTLWFSYQSGTFSLFISTRYLFNLVYPHIYVVSADDYEAISRVRRAINTLNMDSQSTMFYTFDAENKNMSVHMHHAGIIVPETRDFNGIMESMLYECFSVRWNFEQELRRLAASDAEENTSKKNK